jgi:hypothetical protein
VARSRAGAAHGARRSHAALDRRHAAVASAAGDRPRADRDLHPHRALRDAQLDTARDRQRPRHRVPARGRSAVHHTVSRSHGATRCRGIASWSSPVSSCATGSY